MTYEPDTSEHFIRHTVFKTLPEALKPPEGAVVEDAGCAAGAGTMGTAGPAAGTGGVGEGSEPKASKPLSRRLFWIGAEVGARVGAAVGARVGEIRPGDITDEGVGGKSGVICRLLVFPLMRNNKKKHQQIIKLRSNKANKIGCRVCPKK